MSPTPNARPAQLDNPPPRKRVALAPLFRPGQDPEARQAAGIESVGLLGTRYTMEQSFYRGRLTDQHDLNVIVPAEIDRASVHNVIYDELCKGQIREPSRELFRRIVETLATEGAEGIILGCTEIGLLLGPSDVGQPLFDTTQIHARAAVDRALE